MINYGSRTLKKKPVRTKSKSTKRKVLNKNQHQIIDLITQGKKIKTIREYSFEENKKKPKSRSNSLSRKQKSLISENLSRVSKQSALKRKRSVSQNSH